MPEKTTLPLEEAPVLPPGEEHKLIDELHKMAYEELLPVEKKLIGWSIAIGVIALGFLMWLRYTFFPTQH